MKVIFLDIDGVLNSVGYYRSGKHADSAVDETRVRLLKKIVNRTGAKIVLSSSWRLGWEEGENCKETPVGELVNLLDKYGLSIFSKTPAWESDYYIEQLEKLKQAGIEDPRLDGMEFGVFAYNRVFEVRDWLAVQEEPVESFVILDDNDFNWKLLGYENRWIKTSWERRGLSPLQAERAVEILNRRMKASEIHGTSS